MKEKLKTLTKETLVDIAVKNKIRRAKSMSKDELIDAIIAAGIEGDDAPAPQKATRSKKSAPKAEDQADETATASEKKTEKAENETAAAQSIEDAGKESAAVPERKPRKRVLITRGNAAADGNEKKSTRKAVNEEVHGAAPAEEKKPEHVEPLQNTEIREELPEEQEEVPTIPVAGILEVMPDNFGFIRSDNYLPGDHDVYVAPTVIRKFGLKTGDMIRGVSKVKSATEKFGALQRVDFINDYPVEMAQKHHLFENMTPIFPNQKLVLETPGCSPSMRIMDLIDPIGKGQRGMIVSPPKAGKTTLLKEVAKSIRRNYPEIHLIVLLIDERPEEVTDIKETIEGPNSEVIYSTFDELPEHHKRVAEMVIERAKRLVEHGKDVMILLDSITRLTRAYNQVVPPSGRTLSGGLDPAALHMPKRFFGAARNMREGGSLTILATALIETGSKMDDVVYEEFKGTGNMEIILDRKLQEKRIFPAINIPKSSTRREDLLLTPQELDAVNKMRKGFNGMKPDEAVDQVINLFSKTKNNLDFVHTIEKMMF